MTTRTLRHAVLSVLALSLAACASAPKQVDELEAARSAVTQVESMPEAGQLAGDEVTAAHEALREADRLVAERKPLADIRQMAYVAKRHADIAAEQIQRGQAEERAKAAEVERERAILQARQREAQQGELAAKQDAQQAQAVAQQAQLSAQQAQGAAEQSQREAELLKKQLEELQAKQTDRGLVLTLGDVLFDTGQATLKPGATSTLQRVAEFLRQSPDRSVTIEGHTDSVGSDSYNMSLSENRANAVKAALLGQGVPAEKVVALGKGEGSPIAGNDDAAGRQQNRRVEIIISNPPAVARSAG